MVNYNHHRFIPHCTAKLTPLNTLLTETNEGHTPLSQKTNFDLNWNESADLAFLASDVNDFAVGGALQQCVDNVWQPLSFFFSKKLSPAETRYSAFDSELLAVYATISDII